jgi:hypothetical protein
MKIGKVKFGDFVGNSSFSGLDKFENVCFWVCFPLLAMLVVVKIVERG